MDFKELNTFMELIENGTCSKTAKMLYVSQPTITTRIQSLENEFGVKLLKRNGKGYQPTEAGCVLAGYAGRILQLQSECVKALNRMGGLKSETLRIGATALGTYILPDIAKKFKEYYPGVRLFFSISNTSEALDCLKDGSVDAVMVPFTPNAEEDNFHFINVGHDALVLAAGAGNPICRMRKVHIDNLRRELFIVREQGSATRKIFDEWLLKNGIETSNTIEMEQSEAIRRAVAKNTGVSMLSTFSLQTDDASIKIIETEGFPILRQFNIITHNIQKNDFIINTFAKFAKESMEEYTS